MSCWRWLVAVWRGLGEREREWPSLVLVGRCSLLLMCRRGGICSMDHSPWMRSATDSCCRFSPPAAMARDDGPSNCSLSPCKANHAPVLRHFGEAGPYRRRRRARARWSACGIGGGARAATMSDAWRLCAMSWHLPSSRRAAATQSWLAAAHACTCVGRAHAWNATVRLNVGCDAVM